MSTPTNPPPDPEHWSAALDAVHTRIAPRFRRAEARTRSRRYLDGLLSPIERKNGWQMAEYLGETGPQGVQRLLNAADWDADAVRDDLRAYVIEHLGHNGGVLIVDETGFLKKGTKSAGVARQYSGTAGRRENQQVGVFLAYASPRGCAFLDRALYLPETWAGDPARRTAAGIPASVAFARKVELARAMLARAFDAQIPVRWVVGDSVYGHDDLRTWLEERGQRYVLGGPCTHLIWTMGQQVEAHVLVGRLSVDAWTRCSAGAGSQGPRLSDWACIRLPDDAAAGMAHWLLIRRSVSDPTELKFFRVSGPADTAVEEMIRVAGLRWAVEMAIQQAKGEVGLDQYEVRKWEAWYRHVTLARLTHAALEVARSNSPAEGEQKGGFPPSVSRSLCPNSDA
jgi:SRSO17 transposase